MACVTAGAIVGGAVIGGIASSSAAGSAADAQESAAQQASNTQMAMFNKTQQNLAPYMNTGAAANNALMSLTGLGGGTPTYDTQKYNDAMQAWQSAQSGGQSSIPSASNGYSAILATLPPGYKINSSGVVINQLGNGVAQIGTGNGQINPNNPIYQDPLYNKNAGSSSPQPQLSQFQTGTTSGNLFTSPLLAPISMDESTLEQTPGYQFNLTQGLKATQNSAAVRGLGVSGAALKGASTYATGLADSTYQNQFNNAVTNQTNQFNRLTSMANSGQNAAAGLGTQSTQTAANIGNNITGAGNAAAAGYIGAGNAVQTGVNNAQNGYMSNQLLQGMYGNQNGGYSSAAFTPAPMQDSFLDQGF